jgi:hypothetical protein
MSNTLAPFGLRFVRRLDSAAVNYAVNQRQILYSDTTPIGKGDIVKDAGSGYIAKALYNSTSNDFYGVFDGAEWFDTGIGRPVFSNSWTGTTTALTGSVVGYVIVDKMAVFQVQSSGTAAVALADIGTNATFVAAPVPSTITGLSTLALDQTTLATTNTFPMRIVGLSAAVNNDNASANNVVEVIINDTALLNLLGL